MLLFFLFFFYKYNNNNILNYAFFIYCPAATNFFNSLSTPVSSMPSTTTLRSTPKPYVAMRRASSPGCSRTRIGVLGFSALTCLYCDLTKLLQRTGSRGRFNGAKEHAQGGTQRGTQGRTQGRTRYEREKKKKRKRS